MDDDLDGLWQTYSMDAADALREMEESLLCLEAKPAGDPAIHRLYRALHTLKGNSSIMNLTTIESLAHAAEDMIGLVRDRGVPFEQALIELMLQLVDQLGMWTKWAAVEQRDAEPSDLEELIGRIRGWTLEHGGVREKSSLGREEILVWSSLPPRGSILPGATETWSDDQVAVEIFLALARDTLGVLFTRAEQGESALRGSTLAATCADLRRAATTQDYAEVLTCLSVLEATSRRSGLEGAGLGDALADLCAALDRIERQYQRHAEFPQGFDMTSAHERACRLSLEWLAGRELAPSEEPRPEPAVTAAAPSEVQRRPNTREPSPEAAGARDFLRIDARKLSQIMDLTGEIALACGAVTHHPEIDRAALEGFAAAAHKLEVLIRELQNEVSAMRLVPIAGVFQRMRRLVRDTAKRTGKQVELTLRGEDTEIDKVMVDSLHDPLVHLLRNAIDHGIELPEERKLAGKPETGQIVLEASHQGGEVLVRVRDDGRGMSTRKLRSRAEQRGLIEADAQLSEQQLVELVFLPGFSTKEAIDELSGRGVGMDVVKTTIEGLRGRVNLQTTEGEGSRFDLTLPLTLAFVEAMVVRDGERLFAIPIEKIYEVFKAEPEQLCVNSADGELMLRVRERLIPVLWLHHFFGEPERADERLEGRVIVVVQTARGSLALPVDALLGNQPLMLKPLRGVLAGVRAAAGCGMLRTGDVALALDCEQLHGS